MNMKKFTLWTFVSTVWLEFRDNHGMQRASAMAYATLLALVPLFTLSLSMFASFSEMSDVKVALQNKILSHFIPTTGNEIFDAVTLYLDKFMANAKTINTIGIIGLAVTSIALFTAVENSFNFIWRVAKRRSFFARYNAFCGMIIGMPLLIGGSVYLSSLFNIQSLTHGFPVLGKVIYMLLPLFMTWIAFILLYHLVPYTRVRWWPSILAGILAGTLWEIAKFNFGIYVARAVNVSVIYGSVGSILLFLAWLYFTWIIVLLGAQTCYVAQNFKSLAQAREGGKAS